MNISALMPKTAWLPLTPRGVAAFASASPRRLLFVQFLFALAGAAAIGWFLSSAWTPIIQDAIKALPTQSRITHGTLEWPGDSPVILAESRFLSFVVDLEHGGAATLSSDVIVELGKNDWRASSFLGALDLPGVLDTAYPPNYTIALNRDELGPWWNAREPFIIAIAMGLCGLFLLFSWAVLAAVYAPFAWLAGFYANRVVTLRGCWQLAGAALMPGVLFMTASTFFYGLRAFDLLRLALAFGMHFIIGWFYLFASVACLPRHPETQPAGTNPFNAPPSQ
jgi:hypothetical protein